MAHIDRLCVIEMHMALSLRFSRANVQGAARDSRHAPISACFGFRPAAQLHLSVKRPAKHSRDFAQVRPSTARSALLFGI